MSKSEVALRALKRERESLIGQLVRMTQEYLQVTMPLHSRLRIVESELDKAGWL
ncbi:hypothetical protein [Mycobacterium intracellulare]|uniref:hypothetical protein n=1 Tax=Mycobacterium intracellulare TaxID=1767 RepID=UPI000AB985AC|nr:hypothetical protein [Mycobacterium intracellulare]